MKEEAVEKAVAVTEEAGAVTDTHLASLEHSRIKTRDPLVLMMAEQPKLLKITTTAIRTYGTTTLVMTVPIALIRICTMR